MADVLINDVPTRQDVDYKWEVTEGLDPYSGHFYIPTNRIKDIEKFPQVNITFRRFDQDGAWNDVVIGNCYIGDISPNKCGLDDVFRQVEILDSRQLLKFGGSNRELRYNIVQKKWGDYSIAMDSLPSPIPGLISASEFYDPETLRVYDVVPSGLEGFTGDKKPWTIRAIIENIINLCLPASIRPYVLYTIDVKLDIIANNIILKGTPAECIRQLMGSCFACRTLRIRMRPRDGTISFEYPFAFQSADPSKITKIIGGCAGNVITPVKTPNEVYIVRPTEIRTRTNNFYPVVPAFQDLPFRLNALAPSGFQWDSSAYDPATQKTDVISALNQGEWVTQVENYMGNGSIIRVSQGGRSYLTTVSGIYNIDYGGGVYGVVIATNGGVPVGVCKYVDVVDSVFPDFQWKAGDWVPIDDMFKHITYSRDFFKYDALKDVTMRYSNLWMRKIKSVGEDSNGHPIILGTPGMFRQKIIDMIETYAYKCFAVGPTVDDPQDAILTPSRPMAIYSRYYDKLENLNNEGPYFANRGSLLESEYVNYKYDIIDDRVIFIKAPKDKYFGFHVDDVYAQDVSNILYRNWSDYITVIYHKRGRDRRDFLKRYGFGMPGTYLNVYDSTMALVGPFGRDANEVEIEQSRQAIAEMIEEKFNLSPKGVITKEGLIEYDDAEIAPWECVDKLVYKTDGGFVMTEIHFMKSHYNYFLKINANRVLGEIYSQAAYMPRMVVGSRE